MNARCATLCTTDILSVGQRDRRSERRGASRRFFLQCTPAASALRLTGGDPRSPRGLFGGGQQPVAVAEALQRIEQVELRLHFLLHPFGLGEEGAGFGPLAGLVQGIRRRRAKPHSQERIAALVGVGDRLAGVGHGVRQPAQRQLQLAQVAGKPRRVFPVLLPFVILQPGTHRLQRFGQAAEGTEAECGLVQQPGLIGGGQVRRHLAPRPG